MPKTRWFLIGVLFAALASMLGFLYLKAQSYDETGYFEHIALLRQLRQVDAQWELDALKSKSGINAHYDPLADPLVDLKGLADEAERIAQGFDQEVTKKLGLMFRQTMQDKTDLVEQFKSHNSILRNSLTFLPTAADDAQRTIGEAAAAKTADTAALRTLADSVNRLLLNSLVHAQTPTEERAAAVDTELGKLMAARAGQSTDVVAAVDILAAHAKTVLREQKVVSGLLNSIAAVPAAARIDAIHSALNKRQQIAETATRELRTYLVIFSGVLILLLAYVAARLVRSYALINRINQDLQAANEGLEQKVEARTQELSQALKNLKESEAQVIQNEKMSSLGQMVAGVAHEINTPLGYVKGNLEIVASRMNEIAELEEQCGEAVEVLSNRGARSMDVETRMRRVYDIAAKVSAAKMSEELAELVTDGIYGVNQMSEIVVNLKNFSRLDRSGEVRYDLHEGIDATLVIARNVLKHKVEVKKNYGRIPAVLCSPSQINQVILNLVTNAAQAINEAGTITISTGRDTGGRVRIEVTDTGSGIPAEILPKIFDPFFTTKEIGKGTGLGLSIVHKIIESHDGEIKVRSEVGKGTTFTVLLPIKEQPVRTVKEELQALEAA